MEPILLKRLGISLAYLVLTPLGFGQAVAGGEWIATVADQAPDDSSWACSAEGAHLLKGDRQQVGPLPLDAFVTACDPAMDFDGRTLYFAGRQDSGEGFRVWSLNLDTVEIAAVSPLGIDARGPFALPDGSIVYLSSGDLWRQEAEDPTAQQITFTRGHIRSAAVLPDGRILYLHRSSQGGRLFTVLPDGTWSTLWPGLGDVSVRDFNIVDREQLLVLSTDESLWQISIDDPFAPGERVPADLGGTIRGLFRAEEGATFLVAETGGKSESLSTRVATLHVDPEPRLSILEDFGSRNVLAVDTASAARQADVLPSIVKPEQDTGFLFIIDVARTDDPRLAHLDRNEIAEVRIHRLEDSGDRTTLFAVQPEDDGSVYVQAPADTPLAIDLVDRHGGVLAKTTTAIWIRPNERRGCVGCHVSPAYAPPNVRPEALVREPHRLGSGAEEVSP